LSKTLLNRFFSNIGYGSLPDLITVYRGRMGDCEEYI
jgi:hypothetical protein